MSFWSDKSRHWSGRSQMRCWSDTSRPWSGTRQKPGGVLFYIVRHSFLCDCIQICGFLTARYVCLHLTAGIHRRIARSLTPLPSQVRAICVEYVELCTDGRPIEGDTPVTWLGVV
jgi:hypothetical protein